MNRMITSITKSTYSKNKDESYLNNILYAGILQLLSFILQDFNSGISSSHVIVPNPLEKWFN